jgi:hypothetical protein
MKTSDVLRKAGDVLRERGWCQGTFIDGSRGPCCAWGALIVAGGIDGDRRPVERELLELIAIKPATRERLAGKGFNALPWWNDYKGRDASEIMEAIDAAYIVALQEEGVEPEDVL